MNLEKKIAQFLVVADTGPARSKLEPYAELIRELRQRRWTYAKIAATLQTEFGLSVAPSTVFAFVRVRSAPNPIGSTASASKAVRKPRFILDA